MQQVYKRAPTPKCDFNKIAKHLDDCFSIRHIKHRIPLLFTQVSISYLPKSYRKIKFSFYFHTVYTGVFSSCSYRSSYSGRFFSTAIHLSYRFLSSRAYQNIYQVLGINPGATGSISWVVNIEVLGPRSWGPESWSPGSWIPSYGFRVLDPGSRFLGHGFWVLGPHFRLCLRILIEGLIEVFDTDIDFFLYKYFMKALIIMT